MVVHDFAGLQQNQQPIRLASSYRCWFVKKYCWLVCVREKYCSGWKFTIVYDKPQPNKQEVAMKKVCTAASVYVSIFTLLFLHCKVLGLLREKREILRTDCWSKIIGMEEQFPGAQNRSQGFWLKFHPEMLKPADHRSRTGCYPTQDILFPARLDERVWFKEPYHAEWVDFGGFILTKIGHTENLVVRCFLSEELDGHRK